MLQFPSSELLGSMVSRVTQTMFGMAFELAGQEPEASPWRDPWRVAIVPVKGASSITVAVASDKDGGLALGGAVFSCPVGQVDSTMIDDALSELANIVAGQVKMSMGIDHALGLPRVIKENNAMEVAGWKSATLRSRGQRILVWVAVSEGAL